jgi:hypothetical protein
VITLAIDDGAICTGRYLNGKASWSFPSARERTLEISATWQTNGEVKACTWTVNRFSRAVHDMTGEVPFHLKLPVEGPMSFDGRLFGIDWFLRAEMREGRERESVEMPFRVVPAAVSTAYQPPIAKRSKSKSMLMRVLLGIFGAVMLVRGALLLFEPPPPEPPKEAPMLVGWSHDWSAAQNQQRDSHEPILLYLRPLHCGACRLTEKFLQSAEGMRRLSTFIRVQIDPAAEPDIGAAFGIADARGYLIVIAEGEEPRFVAYLADETTLLNAIDPRKHR